MADLVLLFLSLSDSWLPLTIFGSWQVATLLLASSRNWCLISGKAKSWSEGSHWLWEEADLQGAGERWLSRFTCEKTKPLFPSAGSLPKSTAAHTSVASKGNKQSQPCFVFPPSLSMGVCVPQSSSMALPWAVPRAGSALPCAGAGAHPGERPAVGQLPMPGTAPSWDTLGSPGFGQELEKEVPSAYPHSEIPWASRHGIVNCLTDKTLAHQKPGLPKTRAYLFIHHLHCIFSMLFTGKKNLKKLG